jgi:folate-dependent phosphoribosylglycinamide formyltransferase PurN
VSVKICWFTTGRDKEAFTLLREVHHAIEEQVIHGEISLVFMNREKGESPISDEIITFVEKKGIPVELLSSKRFFEERRLKVSDGRSLFDGQVKSKIGGYDFDIIFLAGYMLILSHVLFEPYAVLNLHPSLPKAYKGKWEDVINETIEHGEKTFGAMIHMVDATLDEGAPVSYVKLALKGDEIDELYRNVYRGDKSAKERLFHIMREAEFAVETPLIINTLALISTQGINIASKKVYYHGAPVEGGVDITGEVQV